MAQAEPALPEVALHAVTRWLLALLSLTVMAGGGFFWWVSAQDRQGELLGQGRLLAQAVSLTRLSEPQAGDLVHLGRQLVLACANTPLCQRIYLLERQGDRVVVTADSAPEEARDFEAVYASVGEGVHRLGREPKGERYLTTIPLVGRHEVRLALLGMETVLIEEHDGRTVFLFAVGLSLGLLAGLLWVKPCRAVNLSLLVATGLVITAGASWRAYDIQVEERAQSFARLAESRTAALEDALWDVRELEMEGLARFYEGSLEVTFKEFQGFAAYLLRDQTVQSWSFVSVVPTRDKAAFEAQMRRDGVPDYRIWGDGGARAILYPISQIQPPLGAQLGQDLGAKPELRAALEEAARTRLPTSAKLHDGRLNFIRPIFFGSGALRGFVLAQIPVQDCLKAAHPDEWSSVELSLIQIGAAAVSLGQAPPGAALGELSLSRPIFAFGQVFLATAYAGPAFLVLHPMRAGWVTALLGLLLTGALVLIIDGGLSHREALERLVQARTLALKESEEQLAATLLSIGDAVIATDLEGRITRMNPVAERLTGWALGDAQGVGLSQVFSILNAKTRASVEDPVKRVLATGEVVALAQHTVLVAKDGSEHLVADSAAPIWAQPGKSAGVVLVFRDVTEEYALREQLQQSQRMDAIGQLAGGVAHDFNNMLGGIIGGAEVLGVRLAGRPEEGRYLSLILDSAQRAAGLTQKLLSFARRQPVASTPVDLHQAVREAVALLQSTVDRRIQIEVALNASPSRVVGDLAVLQSVFLNLGINASHAMPEGGSLSFRSEVVELESAYCEVKGLCAGAYVQVEVRDNGCGIPPENLAKIFEPFFTTKAQGKGTGLGLSAALGNIQQHQGTIIAYSEVGRGSVFKVLVPLTERRSVTDLATVPLVRGSGLVLLVDDEPVMRATGSAMLQELGFQVILAEDGAAALALYQACLAEGQEIKLVILDMIMPVMNGRDCFHALRALTPTLKVVLSSGFSREDDLHDLKENGLAGFLQKPFRSAELSRVLSVVLGA